MKSIAIPLLAPLSVCLLFFVTVVTARAGEPAQSTAPLDSATLQRGIANLKIHAASREKRITELTNDIMALDTRIEERVARIVETLKGATDSQESQTKVARTKADVIAGLKRSIEYYDRKRRGLKEETMQRSPRMTREELFDDIGSFDKRIETRITQIVELANSLHTHEDVDKWQHVYDDSSYNHRRSYSRNPEYNHNRKQTTATEQSKSQLVEELKTSVDRIDRRNRDIRATLEKQITPQYREMLTDELDNNEATLSARRGQMAELTVSRQTRTEPMGRMQILRLEELIEDMAKDLRRDFNDLFADYAELNQERASRKSIRDDLAKYETMLEERAAGQQSEGEAAEQQQSDAAGS